MGLNADLNVIRATRESTTALGGSATKNGITYDTGIVPTALAAAGGTDKGSGPPCPSHGKFRAFASADVAGTLKIQQSADNSTWYTTTSAPIPADATQAAVLESMVTLRFIRASVVNGGGAQASFEFGTALVEQ